jgi:hypothetical protein
MSNRKVYIVQSGSLHPTTQTFWLSSRYFSNLKAAIREKDQILKVNRAEIICEDKRKYKARVIVSVDTLHSY